VNGRPVFSRSLASIFVAIYSLDVRDRDSARHIFGDLVGTVHLNRLLLAAAGRAIEVNRPYLKNGKQS